MESRKNLFGLAVLVVFCLWGTGLAEGGEPASNPTPADGSDASPYYSEENVFMILDYTPGQGAITHTAYFSDNFDDVNDRDPAHCLGSVPPWPGVDPDAFVVGYDDEAIVEYARAPLVLGMTYYWCVDADDGTTIWPGAVWSFTVMPEHAWMPTPADGEELVPVETTLGWEMGDIDTAGYAIRYDVYYGASLAAVEAGTATKVQVIDGTSVDIGPLAGETVYYWRVDTILVLTRPPFGEIVVPGDIWQFTTMAEEPPAGGLVAHWKFDEGNGDVAYDSAGDNDGTIYGATWVDGFLGGALDFDGVDDYVGLPDNNPIWLPQNDFAVSAWLYFDRDPGSEGEYILDLNRGHSGTHSNALGYSIHAGTSTGKLMFIITTTTGPAFEQLNMEDTLVKNTWYHVVAVRDGTTQAIYLDGQLNANRTCSSGPIKFTGGYDDDKVNIGTYTMSVEGPRLHFDGLVDDLRIYDRALSGGEVAELYGEGPVEPVGLVSHWRFDEGEGAVAYDSEGSNDGAIYGATWADGILGGALDFDGVDDYVQVADNDSLTPSNGLTVSSWLYIREISWGDRTALVCKYDAASGDRSYLIELGVNGEFYQSNVCINVAEVPGSPGHQTCGTTELLAGRWYHIATTFEPNRQKVYVDGVQEADDTDASVADAIPNNNAPLYIGYEQDENTYFNGTIDDVRIYDVALSGEEVLALYEEVPPVVVGESWHVDCVLGSDDNDGLSRETAFFSIGKGIDSAEDGDSVLVWPGVYAEEVRFMGKAITVRSAGDAATIENPGDFAVSFYYGEGPGSVLKNFVIANSLTGIFIAGSSPTISNVTVVNNMFGIEAYAGSEPDISNAILWDNIESDIYGCEAAYSWVQSDLGPAAPTNGLAAHWKFDEGDGDTAYDSVGDNHGTIHGATWTDGILGGALNFDGDEDYVTIPDDDSLNPSTAITISWWVLNRGGQDAGILKYASCPGESYSPGSSRAYALVLSDTDTHMTVYSAVDTLDIVESDNPLSFNEWHHVVGTFDEGDVAIYADGNLEVGDTMTVSSIMNDAQPLIVGGDWSYCGADRFVNRLNGLADDVRIYDRALTAEEVAALYQPGLDSDPLFANPAAGDYHLRSERGRYWPEHDVWVLDKVTSPCIDAGDPYDDPSAEPMPNGDLVNMGAYGGTSYASMSEWALRGDINHDGIVNMIDFTIFGDYWLQSSLRAREIDDRLACANNLRALGRALLLYANDYDDEYPKADQWCDLLLQYESGRVTEQMFVCPSAEGGPSHYAINPNPGNSWAHPDIVLLFETTAGWNQFGGPEQLAPENHQGEGCNILFVGGHMEFVETERFDELRWE